MPANDTDRSLLHGFSIREAESIGLESPVFPNDFVNLLVREELSGADQLIVLDFQVLDALWEEYGISCVLVYPGFPLS